MKRTGGDALVISRYSTFVGLAADPEAAVNNLRQMNEYGRTAESGPAGARPQKWRADG